MKMKIIVFLIPVSVSMAFAAPKTPPKFADKPAANIGFPRKYVLDTNAVHKQYIDGDFDEAIDKLEIGLKYVTPLSHEDSVFIFKHLGVMYTSKYDSREKGKQFMMRLLEVEPTARIMDMYASDMIYMIFKNIQDEYELAQMKLKRAQDLQAEANLTGNGARENEDQKNPASTHGSGRPSVSNAKTFIWLGAAAVMIGAGVAVYVLADGPKAKATNYEVK
jgi:hypothetical protein